MSAAGRVARRMREEDECDELPVRRPVPPRPVALVHAWRFWRRETVLENGVRERAYVCHVCTCGRELLTNTTDKPSIGCGAQS